METDGEPSTRRAHTILRRRARTTIVKAVRTAGLRKEDLEIEPAVKGKTRDWHLDVRVLQAKH